MLEQKPRSHSVHRDDLLETFLIDYSDSAFTVPHDLLKAEEPAFDADAFTHMGKEMDGCESRRHRAISNLGGELPSFSFDPDAHNFIQVGLRQRAQVALLEISTEWFTGNQVQEVTVIATDETTGVEDIVLARTALRPDQKHLFDVDILATEFRLLCYPDGGISRFRAYGQVQDDRLPRENILTQATISHVSNEHYGTPKDAVFGDRQVAYMKGWESGRTGFGERALFTLAKPSFIRELVVDTYRHVLNAPPQCSVFVANAAQQDGDALMAKAPYWQVTHPDGAEEVPEDLKEYMRSRAYASHGSGILRLDLVLPQDTPWQPLLSNGPLRPDCYNRFKELPPLEATHLLFGFFPNGGIHGLKAFF